jgi:hypothetical protein
VFTSTVCCSCIDQPLLSQAALETATSEKNVEILVSWDIHGVQIPHSSHCWVELCFRSQAQKRQTPDHNVESLNCSTCEIDLDHVSYALWVSFPPDDTTNIGPSTVITCRESVIENASVRELTYPILYPQST